MRISVCSQRQLINESAGSLVGRKQSQLPIWYISTNYGQQRSAHTHIKLLTVFIGLHKQRALSGTESADTQLQSLFNLSIPESCVSVHGRFFGFATRVNTHTHTHTHRRNTTRASAHTTRRLGSYWKTCKREITVRESSFFLLKTGPGRHVIWRKQTGEQKVTAKMWDQTEGERRNGQMKPKKAQFVKKITLLFLGRRLLIGLRMISFSIFFLHIWM